MCVVRGIFHAKNGIIYIAVGLSLSILLFPKAAIWLNQFESIFVYSLYFGNSHLLQEGSVKGLVVSTICINRYITEAAEELEKEREFTEVERDAFKDFIDEVQSLNIQSPDASGGQSNSMVVLTNHSDVDTLETVQNCYRETAMSVPRYDEVYNESFAEHFAAEFGDEIAVTVLDGGPLTPTIQSLLITQASQAVAEREQFLEDVEMEFQSINNAKIQLTDIKNRLSEINLNRIYHYSFDDLIEHHYEVKRAAQKCQDILQERQNDIFIYKKKSHDDIKIDIFQEYLYGELPTQYPVISSTLNQLKAVRYYGKSIRTSITRRY